MSTAAPGRPAWWAARPQTPSGPRRGRPALGWKLAQVLAGAPDALLDTYETERRPVAAHVLGKSSELYQNLSQHRLSGLKRGDEEQQLTLSYRGGPLAGTGTTRTLIAGDRAPDAPCVTADGARRLFDVLRGAHFTLLAFGNAPTGLPWPETGAGLHSYRVVRRPGNGGEIADTSGKLTRTYGVDGDALVLIRPDGYIADATTTKDDARFADAIRALASPS
ncbi:aromatic-ring hydroxylase C-terminal domain-containing protein [Streptomyces odonnellii]|uniref:aromatic-ring hydroxylase C-terminal domain-containing protein n=1 Tax=Streptomyces odonnellii TaxID=1417980 RepID=UPI00069915D3|nr:FAD-dependent monooxygenase [Streptomyces odonnellii]